MQLFKQKSSSKRKGYGFSLDKELLRYEFSLDKKELKRYDFSLDKKELKRYDFSLDKKEPKHASRTYGMEDVLRLLRTRDFLCLILSYPMKIVDQSAAKTWINKVLWLNHTYFRAIHRKNKNCLKQMKSLNISEYFSIIGDKIERLLSERPLRYVEGLIPQGIIRDVRNGWMIIFNHQTAAAEKKSGQQLTSLNSKREGEQLFDLNDAIPESILNLAADLAIEQLIQTLQMLDSHVCNIHIVRFSTRNEVEKQTVKGKIEEALNEVVQISEQHKGSPTSQGLGVRITSNRRLQKVLWVDASKYQNSAEVAVEQEIAKQLEFMKKTMLIKNILVIVVDGSGERKLDLQQMHFPHGNERPGVVVLLTTEKETDKNSASSVKVDLEIRTEDHLLSWVLFCKNVGCELVCSSCAIQSVAVEIVKECCGHLLVIVLVARSLKNVTDVKLWKLAWEKLRTTSSFFYDRLNNLGSVSKPIMINAIKNIIWKDINIVQKQCLEHCLSVFKFENMVPDKFLISEWVNNGLVYTREEAEYILQDLVGRSVLLNLEGNDIQLPKETGKALQSLFMSKPIISMKQGGLGLTKSPYTQHWKNAQRIELMNNKLSRLPASPDCFELKILLLQGNADLMEIPPSFFFHMPRLHILDLSCTSIRTLPSCISWLHELKELYLGECKLLMELPLEIGQLMNLERLDVIGTQVTDMPPSPNWPKLRELHLQCNAGLTEIPSLFFRQMHLLNILDLSQTSISDFPSSFFDLERLKELYLRGCDLFMELPSDIKQVKTLEKLDLEGTQITHLPREIQELTNLQSLTLCFDGYTQNIDQVIPDNVISKLTLLNFLSIDVNPDDKWWDENAQVILPEISWLRMLNTLVLYIPRVELLKYIPDSKYFDFRLTVGDHKNRIILREPPLVPAKFKESKHRLRFVNGVGIPNEINTILRRTEAFFLDRHMSIKSLSEFEVGYAVQLSVCILAECNEMRILVDGNFPNKNLLFYVEFLSVYYMKNLISIWEGPAPSHFSFHDLKYLALHTCPKLTTIFTLDFLDNLSMLEELIVEDCPKISTLISYESSKLEEKCFLPKLKKLLLVYLPELASISSGLLIGESLEKVGFYYCPKLRSMSMKELSSKELKVIKGETNWWEALKWSQAEWGEAGRPYMLNDIFSPINEEADVMSQLITELT